MIFTLLAGRGVVPPELAITGTAEIEGQEPGNDVLPGDCTIMGGSAYPGAATAGDHTITVNGAETGSWDGDHTITVNGDGGANWTECIGWMQ